MRAVARDRKQAAARLQRATSTSMSSPTQSSRSAGPRARPTPRASSGSMTRCNAGCRRTRRAPPASRAWSIPVGKIDPDGQVDLRQIRKPGFFAKAPYNEAVAEADGRTHVVEFTVPRDPLERLKLNMQGDIKLRGWYVEGAGVDDGRGGRTRALVIMSRRRRRPADCDPASRGCRRHHRSCHASRNLGELPECHDRRHRHAHVARPPPRTESCRIRRAGVRPSRRGTLRRLQRHEHARAERRHLPRARPDGAAAAACAC